MEKKVFLTDGQGAAAAKRIEWLHGMIKGGSFPNAARLREEFGISVAQSHRDTAHLKALGAPMVYDHDRGGFRYTAEFSLPGVLHADDAETSVSAISAAEKRDADSIQISIPYTAEIEAASRHDVMGLGRYVVSRGNKKGIFRCEFRNPDLFLGMLLALDAPVRILSPGWLREKLVEKCSALAEKNAESGMEG